MGEFEKEPNPNGPDGPPTISVSIISLLMTFLAFFAPVGSAGYSYGNSYFVNISAILWSVYLDEWGFRFSFINPFTAMMMVPFVLFRVGSVFQLSRYFQGKTTKGRARIGAILADAPFLFVYGIWLFTMGITSGIGLNLPLPIMMIVGFLLLWKFPAFEPTVPWEGSDEFKPWWEEDTEEKAESTAENQPW
jgi:hypothetical protein